MGGAATRGNPALMQPMTVHLPALPQLVRHAGQHILEATLAPLLLFYLLLRVVGFSSGLYAALGWSLAAILTRLVTRRPVPAVLLLMTGLLTIRTVVGLATGSAFLYFLQPSVQNFLIAAVLLASLPLERPFIAKLAGDFCAFPAALTDHPRVLQFFRRVSVLWAAVFTVNGVTTLWTLARATIGDFLVVSTAGSYTLVVVAAVASLAWFRRCMRGENIRLRLGVRIATAAV